jgi:hypothetical protein
VDVFYEEFYVRVVDGRHRPQLAGVEFGAFHGGGRHGRRSASAEAMMVTRICNVYSRRGPWAGENSGQPRNQKVGD